MLKPKYTELSPYGSQNISAFFAGYIYVNFAQNQNFKLVTMNGYVHNLFTPATFGAIV